MAFDPTVEQQAHMIETIMQSPEHRLHVAHKMMPQIQKERDYVSIGRQGLILDQLAQGDVPYYDVSFTSASPYSNVGA